jgi:cation diffusion facilitator CzcD-associated flavoprotein CzcO
MTALPVAIIGAGPVGLAAAAHLAERRESFVVLEAGPAVGHAISQWGHVRVFSPWRFNIDKAALRLLTSSGWRHPDPDGLPTGGEIVSLYLEPLAGLPALRRHIRLGARVTAVGRRDFDKVKSAGRDLKPFALRVASADGGEYELLARAVIDCSGTWFSPNPLGSGGYLVTGERAARDAIAYGIPDVLGAQREIYAGKTTLVVGSGHSATNAVLDLVALAGEEPRTHVLWAVRHADTSSLFGGESADALAARGALGTEAREAVADGRVELLTSFRARRLERHGGGRLRVHGLLGERESELRIDRLIVATGFRPDFSFLREVRLSLDPWLETTPTLAPLIDPNLHSCGTVRSHGAAELAQSEKNFYIAGMKSYGRAPTFLLATGYEQVRSIVAALAGDHAAAKRVELDLPQTGVCTDSRPRQAVKAAAGTGCCGPVKTPVAAVEDGCCGGPAPAEVDACCLADAEAKAKAKTGCGCG